MRFGAHLGAGAAAGTTAAALAILTGSVDTIEEGSALAGLTVAFSLFPDLDVASRPQRWFYRALLAGLVVLIARGHAEAAAWLGAAGLLPLIHRHRGWTHRWWAALLVPLALLGAWEAEALAGAAPQPLALAASLGRVLAAHAPFYLAMVAGYAVHLACDRVGPRARR